jgi:hypothetical protein
MKPRDILIGIAIGSVLYAPVSHYVFGTTIEALCDRAYFSLGGALIALWCSGAFKSATY